jgi:hypothetical protein
MLEPMTHTIQALAGALFFLALADNSAPAQTTAAVSEADLSRHVHALASDAMNGRATGTPEAMEAARYIAEELARFGVAPGGLDGTYFQKVPLSRTEFLEVPRLSCTLLDNTQLPGVAGIDFDLATGGCDERRLKVVQVKSAGEIPAKADVGVALVFPTASAKERNDWLTSAGAPEGLGFGLLITLGSEQPGRRAMERPPRPRSGPSAPTPRISVRATVRDVFETGAVKELRFSAPLRQIELEAVNVVGKLVGKGSEAKPGLAEEVIELSAHYDHLPPKEVPEGEDGIYNGADDDASGCAVVLELAEALAAGPRPARTVLFFFATGEEIGLVGTKHSLEHPLVPLDKIVLDVNFEMLGRPDPLLTAPDCMWLTGYELSNLGPELRRLGLPVVEDRRPDQNFFQRSDNYALALRGIVAQTLSSFGMHEDYHRVSDDPASLDYQHMAACAKAALAACQALADGTFQPRWHEGMDPSKREPRVREAAGEKPKPGSKGN